MSRFAAVVRGLIVTPPVQLEERACPDQYVGTLGQLRADGVIASRFMSSTRPNHSAVLLILESPHIFEFRHPLGPAKGTTGRLIAKHALCVPGLHGKDNASLVLINAIQYQCSLGEKPSRHRDEVFIAAWQNFGRSDFVARLKATYQASDLVVCACTKGGDGELNTSLRQLVYAAIVDALPKEARILRRTHPSSWFSQKNRDHEWAAANV